MSWGTKQRTRPSSGARTAAGWSHNEVSTVADYGDAAYLDNARGDLARLVALDNRFDAADIVRMSYKFFKSLQNMIGIGAYEPALEKTSTH